MAVGRSRLQARARAPVNFLKSLRDLLDVAMDLERRTMRLYCRFERIFRRPEEVRAFWFEMAQHESRHYGALMLVAALLEDTPARELAGVRVPQRVRVERLRRLLSRAEAEARRGLTLTRAFALALAIEGSEIEGLVLNLLTVLRGEAGRGGAPPLVVSARGALCHLCAKRAANRSRLARADARIEQQRRRLRRVPGARKKSRVRAPGSAARSRR